MKKGVISLVIIGLFSFGAYYTYNFQHTETIETLFGECAYDTEISKLIKSGPIQRLKNVDQSGPKRYFGMITPSFSRFDHSIGVFHLLRKYQLGIKEQIAGLFHDASHTVFSHVGDYIFAKAINENVQDSYQDKIHLKYLASSNIGTLLQTLDLTIKDLDIETNEYVALDQPLPDMCADRIEYNLHTGYIFRFVSKRDIKNIISDLKYKDGQWYFTNPKSAKQFATLSLHFTKNLWGSFESTVQDIHLAKALQQAMAIKLISKNDLFKTDMVILKKIVTSDDRIIKLNLEQCDKPLQRIEGQQYRYEKFYPKFRGVDPLVQIEDGKLVRLTEIDTHFKEEYDRIKEWCLEGYQIHILDIK